MYHYSKTQLLDFIIPSIILTGLLFLSHQTTFDISMARHFFSPTEGWIYRDNFVLEKILHKGGVIAGIIFNVILVGLIIYFWKRPDKKKFRDYLGFIFISSLLTILAVFFLKKMTTFPCPWNSDPFAVGGTIVPPLWKMFSLDLPARHCFPGGHSSGGYCYLSMYFGYTFIYGKRNFFTLLPGLIIGLVFGITQQMRGAHFVSHDIATIILSIFCSWVTSLIYSYYNVTHEN
jgi:membrane-associated PAP2 superfamily phosphatase